MDSIFESCLNDARLEPEDRERIVALRDLLPFLTDLGDSHLTLYLKSPNGTGCTIAAETTPSREDPLYLRGRAGETCPLESEPMVARAFRAARVVRGVEGSLNLGIPLKETFVPVRAVRGDGPPAVVRIGKNLFKTCNHRLSGWSARRMAEAAAQLFNGALRGPELTPFISCCSGLTAVDRQGFIRYADPMARTHLQRLELADSNRRLRSQTWLELDRLQKPIYLKSVARQGTLEEEFQAGTLFFNRKTAAFSSGPIAKLVVLHNISGLYGDKIGAQVQSTVLQEIHHRVKNNLQTVASLLRMQARRSADPEMKKILGRTIDRILSISSVHEALSHRNVQKIALNEIARNILKLARQNAEDLGLNLSVSVEGGEISLSSEIATPLALVMNELVQNAMEHGFSGKTTGAIGLSFTKLKAGRFQMIVEDDGCGFPDDFAMESQANIGLNLIHSIVESDLAGSIRREKTNRGGCRFIIEVDETREATGGA